VRTIILRHSDDVAGARTGMGCGSNTMGILGDCQEADAKGVTAVLDGEGDRRGVWGKQGIGNRE